MIKIEFDGFFKFLGRYGLLLGTFFILGGIGGTIAAQKIVQQVYEAKIPMIVPVQWKEEGNENNANVQLSLTLAKSYEDILKSPFILDEIRSRNIDKGGENLSEAKINKLLSLEYSDESQVFFITVTSRNQQEAVYLADSAFEIFQGNALDFFPIQEVKKLTLSETKAKAIKPPVIKFGLFGAFGGLLISLGVSVIWTRFGHFKRDNSAMKVSLNNLEKG